MNMKYRLTALFTAVVMLLSVCLAAVAEDVDGGITKQEYDANLDSALDVFYTQLMAAETYDEFSTLISRMSQDQLNTIAAMFSDEYNASLNAKVADLLSTYATDEGQEVEEEEPFVSEILYVTVPYTRVAAFKAPVVGTSNSKARTMAVSSASYALTPRATGTDDNNGLELSKSVVQNADGSYTLTLEAYATGDKVITEVKKDVPTDIVLVLDQSGSMADPMYTYGFREYSNKTNNDYYAVRHNNNRGNENLYYKLDDGSYASVAVTVIEGESKTDYTKIENRINYYYSSYSGYIYAKVNGEYQKVTVASSGWVIPTFTYRLPNGTEIASSDGNTGVPSFDNAYNNKVIDEPYLYLASTSVDTSTNVYTYQYTDVDGVTHTIGTSTGYDTKPTEFVLYEKYQTGSESRLSALKKAVNTLVTSVNEKAAGVDGQLGTDDDINHRIAVVGFAGVKDYQGQTNYENTEVFIGSSQYGYGDKAKGVYASAFQSMNTQVGRDKISASIGALAASGGTHPEWGMEMANGILGANPVPEGEKRNRVVIMFTDGQPGNTGYDSTTANNAITQASTTKTTYGATVYSIGIFTGADASSAGSNANGATGEEKANWFMQQVSSNNGTPRTPSYYLSAADANDLNSIFKQIAENIESGGSSSTLTSSAVVRDIIAPSFTLPKNADKSSIKVYAAEYQNGGVFADKVAYDAGTVSITTDENDVTSIDVSGFDFSENWVGTETAADGKVTYRGKKLIIEIPIVMREGFLGGNNVPTNGANSGVYANAEATSPIETFVSPEVNVPIAGITVKAQDKNVYLLGDLTQAQMKDGATATFGEQKEFKIDPSKENFGLEEWQNKYVSIEFTTETEAQSSLINDTEFEVTCSVSPKSNGTGAEGTPATAMSGKDKANINVFKPVMTFADSVVEYLSTHTFPTYFEDTTEGNKYRDVVWKHGETKSTDSGVTMTGPAPTLLKEYSYANTDIDDDGKIIATADIPVDVAVKIGEIVVTNHVTFEHQCDCELDQRCGWNEESGAEFLLHVKNIVADLTITKTGLDKYAYADDVDREMAIFTVTVDTKDGQKTYTIALADDQSATIKDVLVGTDYTITEQNDWTWRYENKKPITGTMAVGGKSETINNVADNPYWLGGDNYAVNVFGTTTTGDAGTN